jgi:hypothetical protein
MLEPGVLAESGNFYLLKPNFQREVGSSRPGDWPYFNVAFDLLHTWDIEYEAKGARLFFLPDIFRPTNSNTGTSNR